VKEEQAEEPSLPSEVPQPPLAKRLALSDPEVPKQEEGYGPAGGSAQGLTPLFQDREVMKRTLLRGSNVIYVTQVCDNMRKLRPGTKTQESLKQSDWKKVMQAGLSKYRIGAYDEGVNAEEKKGVARVTLELPGEEEEAQREYHNRLMMLCGLSLTELGQAIEDSTSKRKKVPPKRVAKRQRGSAAEEADAAEEPQAEAVPLGLAPGQ
jgi:hypothetical protein